MPPKENEVPKKIEISKDLLSNGDDSSDEEDYYQETEESVLKKNLDQFVAKNPNLPKELVETTYVLENEGRKLLYSKSVRDKYYQRKRGELTYSEKDLEKIKTLNFEQILFESLQRTCSGLFHQFNFDEIIQESLNQLKEKYKDELPRLILKQSNSEFIIKEFANLKQNLTKIILQNYPQSQNLDSNQNYQITPERILRNESIKNILLKKLKEELLPLWKGWINENNLEKYIRLQWVKNLLKPTKINDCFEAYLLNKEIKFESGKKAATTQVPKIEDIHGKVLGTLLERILDNDIENYLENKFLDKTKINKRLTDSYLLGLALGKAKELGVKTITDCTEQNFKANNAQSSVQKKNQDKINSEFDQFLSNNIQRILSEKRFDLPRRVLKKTYNDLDEIKSSSDFYAKEHLLYRSAIRQSRNGEQEIARDITFHEQEDLTVQKWQSIKSQKDASEKHISFRGTLQEEVYNLGNYESVLGKIKSLVYDDKTIAGLIRGVYQQGIAKTLNSRKLNEKPLSEIYSQQQKQTLVELVELFFGTEAFRSPSAIAETNMALDLIIAEKLSWKEVLTGKTTIGRGGALSFTMKSSEQKAKKDQEKIEGAGGIESGRQLSEDVNLTHSRKHKYGGEPIGRETEGYKEYLSRKKDIVEKWLELQEEIQKKEDEEKPKSSTSKPKTKQVEQPSPKTAMSNPLLLKQLIDKKEQEWYK